MPPRQRQPPSLSKPPCTRVPQLFRHRPPSKLLALPSPSKNPSQSPLPKQPPLLCSAVSASCCRPSQAAACRCAVIIVFGVFSVLMARASDPPDFSRWLGSAQVCLCVKVLQTMVLARQPFLFTLTPSVSGALAVGDFISGVDGHSTQVKPQTRRRPSAICNSSIFAASYLPAAINCCNAGQVYRRHQAMDRWS